MIRFDSDALYSLQELGEILRGVVELPTLMERLGLRDRRVFRDAVWGWEILEAARRARPFKELQARGAAVAGVLAGSRGAGRGNGRRGNAHDPLRKLGAKDLAL